MPFHSLFFFRRVKAEGGEREKKNKEGAEGEECFRGQLEKGVYVVFIYI